MYIFTLDQGQELKVPANVSETTYSNKIDFELHEYKYLEAVTSGEDGTEHLIEAVRAVYNTPDGIEVDNGKDDVVEMLNSHWKINLMETEITVTRLYVHYVSLINGYFRDEVERVLPLLDQLNLEEDKRTRVNELVDYIRKGNNTQVVANASLIFAEMTGIITINDKRLTFHYKGDNYHIYATNVEKFFTNRFTVGESKEVLEFRRLINLKAKDKDYRDMDGMDAFRLGLRPLAILARRDGEPLPKNNQKRKVFLDSRERHLADVPMNIIYQVMFFFIRTLADVTESRYIDTFMEDSHKRNQKDSKTRSGQGLRVKQVKEVVLSSRS